MSSPPLKAESEGPTSSSNSVAACTYAHHTLGLT